MTDSFNRVHKKVVTEAGICALEYAYPNLKAARTDGTTRTHNLTNIVALEGSVTTAPPDVVTVAPATYSPSVSISPATFYPGDSFTATISGGPPNTTASVSISDPSGTLLGTSSVMLDGSGSKAWSQVANFTQQGNYQIVVTFDSAKHYAGGNTRTANFTLNIYTLPLNGTTQCLTRTLATPGDRTRWTWSGWLKRSDRDSLRAFLSAYSNAPYAPGTYAAFRADNGVGLYYDPGSPNYYYDGDQTFGTSGWFHVVIVWDTTNPVAQDRVRIYVNGVRQTISAWGSGGWPTSGLESTINSVVECIGALGNNIHYYPFKGEAADINFLDGYAVDADGFGYFNGNGSWSSKPYSGAYGKTGYHLIFSNRNNLGKDFAPITPDHPNPNNFTAVGY